MANIENIVETISPLMSWMRPRWSGIYISMREVLLSAAVHREKEERERERWKCFLRRLPYVNIPVSLTTYFYSMK